MGSPKVEYYGSAGAEERIIVDIKLKVNENTHYVQIRVYNTCSSIDFTAISKYFQSYQKPKNKAEISFEHLNNKTVVHYFASEVMEKVVDAVEGLVDVDSVNEYVRKLAVEGLKSSKENNQRCGICQKEVNEKNCLKCDHCKSSVHISCGKNHG